MQSELQIRGQIKHLQDKRAKLLEGNNEEDDVIFNLAFINAQLDILNSVLSEVYSRQEFHGEN